MSLLFMLTAEEPLDTYFTVWRSAHTGLVNLAIVRSHERACMAPGSRLELSASI